VLKGGQNKVWRREETLLSETLVLARKRGRTTKKAASRDSVGRDSAQEKKLWGEARQLRLKRRKWAFSVRDCKREKNVRKRVCEIGSIGRGKKKKRKKGVGRSVPRGGGDPSSRGGTEKR